MAMLISPLTPALGAEISGVDIHRLDAVEIDKLHRSWLKYKVIFLREQNVDLDELQHFSRHFGELMQLP
jgi:taurine dioxygenase